ncbi:RNA methyltransferase [Pseudonocardiaceae bacterium YIM PH 21723]|nr:RNA methyltransferase [Pseudonocardiaceae bacterium YIM PH 21723]
MPEVIEIDRADDPRLDDFRDLSMADRRPDRPGGRGLVIAEGVVVVRRLISSGYPVRALLGVARRIEELEPDLADLDVPAYVAPAELMAEVVGFHLNRGVLATADRKPQPRLNELAPQCRNIALLEGVTDHENLGSLFRNAAALGIDGVVLAHGCSDPLYRRSVRVSMGHVLRVPFTVMPYWNLGLKTLREHGFTIAALTPAADAESLAEADLGQKTALLLGSEGHGLSEQAMADADLRVRIPMAGLVDSLNVATAAAIAFYQVTA